MSVTQKGNSAGGDIVAGDKKIYNVRAGAQSPISALYERLRENDSTQLYTSKIADKLQHFAAVSVDGDIRGLEQKLTAADRTDLLMMAKRLKEDAAKLVMRLQTSPIAQDILTLVLSKVYSDFVLHVTPAIESDQSRQVVDALISDKVISNAMIMLEENEMMLTDADILGLVFFLGGNCHIRWDKC